MKLYFYGIDKRSIWNNGDERIVVEEVEVKSNGDNYVPVNGLVLPTFMSSIPKAELGIFSHDFVAFDKPDKAEALKVLADHCKWEIENSKQRIALENENIENQNVIIDLLRDEYEKTTGRFVERREAVGER